MVFLIALLPAVFVVVIAACTKSRTWTGVAAVVAAVLGVLTGNPAYAALDFAAVGVGTWLAFKLIPKAIPQPPKAVPVSLPPSPAPKPAAKPPKDHTLTFWVVAAVASAGFCLYTYPPGQPRVVQASPVQPSPVSAALIPAKVSPAAANALPSAKAQGTAAATSTSPSRQSPKPRAQPTPLEKCLQLKSDDRMEACLARL